MAAALLIALLCQEPSPPADSLEIRFEAWRPRLHGGMRLDKAFGVDFLEDDEADPGTLSFDDDAGFDKAANAGRVSLHLLTEPDFGPIVRIAWAGWTEEQTLAEGEDFGGGTILPAGTVLDSRLSFWSLQGAMRGGADAPPFRYEFEIGASWFLLNLEGRAAGGQYKSRNASVGVGAGGRVVFTVTEGVNLEAWGRTQLGIIINGLLFEGGLRLGAMWSGVSLDAGYMLTYGNSSEGEGFAMESPTVGLTLRF